MSYHCYEIIQQLESTSSRLEKEAIIDKAARNSNLELFHGFRLAYDATVTFGVKKVPVHSGPDGQGLPWPAFLNLATQLQNRTLTGAAAKQAIELAMSVATKDQWNKWMRLILIKDMRAGLSEATTNKVLKAYPHIEQVPVFECMLAHDGANHEKKITGKKSLQIKLDGVRTLTVVNIENRTVVQYSRNGKVFENFSHITNSLEQHIDMFTESVVLDGETVSSSFQALMKQAQRKSNVNASDASLMLFDIIPLSEFREKRCTLTQDVRSAKLKALQPIFDKIGSISVVPATEVDLNTVQGRAVFNEFNASAIEDGFEGIMIKDIKAVYEFKRSHSWLKVKPVITVDLEVIALEEGTGKNEGKLGALVCKGVDNGKLIVVNVGSGLTDAQRDEFWAASKSVVGKIVEVKADCITKNQDSTDTYSLRFPRFERFRGFDAGQKL